MGRSALALCIAGLLSTTVIILMLGSALAEGELEVFAGQDKTGRVDLPVEFNDAQIVQPDPLDPGKTYSFHWDFDDRKDSNLDGIRDNDDMSQERYTQWTYHISGTYIVTLTVDDGEYTAKDTLMVTVAPNQPPQILANDTEAARAGTEHVFFAYAADDASPSHLLRWYWDFDDGTTSEDPPPVAHTFASEGTYDVIVRVTDQENAWTEHTITVTVSTFLVTSTVNIEEGETLRGQVTFMGAITSDVPLSSVEVRLDGGEWTTAEGVMAWSYTLDTTAMEHGEHTIEVRALSASDSHDLICRGFYVDNPPVVDIAVPTPELPCNGTVLATGTASDDAWLDHVAAAVDDDPWTAADGTNGWSFPIDTTGLDHGDHVLHVRAYDGEQYSEVVSVHFTVDQVPMATIGEGSTWTETPTGLVVSGTCWDDGTEPVLELRLDGGEWRGVVVGPRGAMAWTWNDTVDTTGLAMGDHVIDARAFDGRQHSPVATATFHIDRPPEVSIDPMPEDREVRNRLDLSGTQSDDGVVEGVQYRIDGGEWVDIPIAENWSVTIPVEDLKPGIHLVEVRVYDGSQYSDIATTTFRKEKEDEPGLGAPLAAMAIFSATLVALRRRS